MEKAQLPELRTQQQETESLHKHLSNNDEDLTKLMRHFELPRLVLFQQKDTGFSLI